MEYYQLSLDNLFEKQSMPLTATAENTDSVKRTKKNKKDTGIITKKRGQESKPQPVAYKVDVDKQKYLQYVIDAMRTVSFRPGARLRVEQAVLSDETHAFPKVIAELSKTQTTELTFKRSCILYQNGKTTQHIMWYPVYLQICTMIRSGEWIQDRKKEEAEDEQYRSRKRGWNL